MANSRSKFSEAAVQKRRGNVRNVLLGVLFGLAVIFVVLAGRYAYGKSKDPNYSLSKLFGITRHSGSLPDLPTSPLDGLIPDTSSQTSADEATEASTMQSTEETLPSTEEETTPEETTPEETSSETETAEETTEEETSEEETSEEETSSEDPMENDPENIQYHLDRTGLTEKDLASCKQLIIVQSNGTQCTLFFFEKTKEGWALSDAIPTTPGIVGMNGVSREKYEGDGCTPAGFYALGPCYGEDANSLTRMEYHQIVEGDYWVDDVDSFFYNTLVHEEVLDKRVGWNSGEDLYNLLDFYRYMVVIRYNMDLVVPGAGSAIFLHCQAGSSYTRGCVATMEATMFAIFNWLDPDSDPHILIY